MSSVNVRTDLCNVGYLSERAGKTRQYYLKVVFVNHKRSHFGTGVALIVGDLRGRPECPNLAGYRPMRLPEIDPQATFGLIVP